MLFCRLPSLILLSLLCSWMVLPASAATDVAAPEPQVGSANLVQLPPVTVRGLLEIQATGQSRISRKLIDRLPRGNGSTNELLGILPDVQVSEQSRSSLTGGEILPPEISISGGQAYQNNFLIDGLSNNSLLDPTQHNPNDPYDVPGQSQELFLDSDLIGEVQVYDSNVPARYGDFTGGVVDATTRMPGPEFSGKLSYRHTRDSWTKFHLQDSEHFDFANSASAVSQPRFEKHHAGLQLNLPLTDATGVLFGTNWLYSRIPLRQLDATQEQSRSNLNLLAKLSHELSPTSVVDAAVTYAPYQATYFLPDTLNSKYSIYGGGAGVNLQLSHFFDSGELKLGVGYLRSENRRDAPQWFRKWAATDSKPWGRIVNSPNSLEGGFGDIDKTQQELELNLDWSAAELGRGAWRHKLNAGLEEGWLVGTFERSETAIQYTGYRISPDVICGDDLTACVDREQFFVERSLYQPVRIQQKIFKTAAYLEDVAQWRRLTLRPGLRLSYDDYLKNANLAPRLAAAYDLWGSGGTVLLGGLNRYYGRSLLAFKLREAKRPPLKEYRTTFNNLVQDWVPDPNGLSNVARFSDLKTPYTDELVVGLDQKFLGSTLSAKRVLRLGRDQFSREYGPVEQDGLRYYTTSNRGHSRHESYRISWSYNDPQEFFLASWNFQRTSTAEDQSGLLADEEGDPRVWYQGQVVYKSELPRQNIGRKHIVKLLYSRKFAGGVDSTLVANYLGSQRVIRNSFVELPIPASNVASRTNPVSGEPIEETLYVYQLVKQKPAWLFDAIFHWQLPGRMDNWHLSLEIDNLLNRRLETMEAPGTYFLGRQFWLGAECRF